MTILIKGMEMPTWCNDCPFNDKEYDVCVATTDRRSIRIPVWEKMRLFHREKWCPLIEVPTPHGRLIDENWLKKAMITTLEALKKNPRMDGQEMHLIAAFDTLRVMVEDAPTVIEAEE